MPKTYTETVCSRCGRIEREEGPSQGVPPVSWAWMLLRYRARGQGWSGHGHEMELELCETCAYAVENFALNRSENPLHTEIVTPPESNPYSG